MKDIEMIRISIKTLIDEVHAADFTVEGVREKCHEKTIALFDDIQKLTVSELTDLSEDYNQFSETIREYKLWY